MDWFFMRPIMADKTTYTEIRNELTLCDLLDLHEALDIQEEVGDHVRKQGK